MKLKLALIWLGITAGIVVGFLNCSRVPLEKFEKVEFQSLAPEATFCVNPPAEVGRYANILFVIDVTGSNSTSDPGKVRRLNAMREFFDKHKTNTYIKWGLEIFAGGVPASAQHLIQDADLQNYGTAADFEDALTKFQAQADSGGTPYVAALNEAKNAIEKKVAQATAKNEDPGTFQVVFIFDGVPTGDSDATIFDLVKRMVDLAGGQLHLSTVFYNVGGPDPTASDRLKEMARIGNGRFQDASSGQPINIDDLIMGGAYKEPYFIKDVFVYNLNSAVCDDGNIKADSDGDGICDEDEERYNTAFKALIDADPTYKGKTFSATNRNSFDPRFSDLIMYKHLVEGEILVPCDATPENINTDADHDMLNKCEEMYMYSKAPEGPTKAWTDAMIKAGNSTVDTNFDSDGDGILDSLEFLFFKKQGYAMNYNTINSRMNGRTLYDYFKNHQSVLRPESSLPYNISVQWIRKNNAGLNCYRIDQENLPIYKVSPLTTEQTGGKDYLAHGKDENVILVYYLMTTENDPDGKGVMRYSYQKRSYNANRKVDYNDTKFDEVKAK